MGCREQLQLNAEASTGGSTPRDAELGKGLKAKVHRAQHSTTQIKGHTEADVSFCEPEKHHQNTTLPFSESKALNPSHLTRSHHCQHGAGLSHVLLDAALRWEG